MAAVTVERSEATDPGAGLLHGLGAEAALLRDLRAALAEQREALAQDDAAALETVVNQIGRTLLSLRETRRQRAAMIDAVAGVPGAGLNAALERLGPGVAGPVQAALQELHALAGNATRELAVNQAVLRRAIESGELFLQQMLSAPVGSGSAASYPAAAEAPATGLLLNQQA